MSCIVKHCKSIWTPQSDIKFHYFPKDPQRRAKWLSLIPLKGKFYQCARICSLHFKPTDQDVERPGRLITSATPFYLPMKCDHDPLQTYFPPCSPHSNIEQEIELHTNSNHLKENMQFSTGSVVDQSPKPSSPGTSNLLLAALLTAKRQEPKRNSLQLQEYEPPVKRPRMKDFDMQVRMKTKLEIKLAKRRKILLQKISRQEKKIKDMELKIVNILQGNLYNTSEQSNHSTPNDDVIGEKRKTRVTNSTRNTDYPVDEDSQQSNGNHFDNNDINCTEVEYLEEDADSDDSDDSADIKPDIPSQKPDIEDPTIMFEQDFKLTLDDVDFLFLSYARTFRSLAKQFQTMLKLDIAKLFARYEMKNNLNTTEGCKQEEPPSEPVKPSTPDETEPPLAATVTQSVENPPQFVVKPPQFVVKPSQFVVKPSQFVLKPHQTVQPPQPVALPSPDKIANFIPAKEPNKKIFKRVPLQAVMSGVIAKTITSSPQVTQAKPKETVNTPQIILVPPSRQAAIQQTELPQITGTNELEKNTVNKYIRVDSVPKQFDATVKLERLNTDASTLSSRSDSPQPPAPKVMKYYVPKKGPAYAIFSKNSVQLPTVQDTKDSLDSDLDMEVTEQVRTETVFVPTDHVGYCEEEEASDSSVSS